jgi:metal-sulfur cluster biosynthetic enzyme
MTAPDTASLEAQAELEIREALREVVDPEVGVNIVDLGLVYRIERSDEHLRIELTMTSPACPMAPIIIDDVRAVAEVVVPEDTMIEVDLVWEPPWEPGMMSDAARQVLGWPDS